MAFTSLYFLLFLTAVVFVFYLVPRKFQWIILLVASYSFYIAGGFKGVFYLLGTTLITYGAALWIQKIRNQAQEQIQKADNALSKEEKRAVNKAASSRIHRIQVCTVLFHLAVLATIKYTDFFIRNLNELLVEAGIDISFPLAHLFVPLGLSYYTFNSIGYLIDVGRGKQTAETHLGRFALFVSFFPSIVQGPLNRYNDLGQQLKQEHKFDYNTVKFGAQLMMWGFFKKMVIADRLAPMVHQLFEISYTGYNGSEVFLGALAYSFQIYGDFSGGIDITRGAAQMLGIHLPLNFERPFFATSLADFWRRWHMSLGAWMKEYVFFPIMLSKPVTALSKVFRKRYGSYAGKMVPSVAAPMVVFFLIAIWHDIDKQYILNGLYNALIISSSVALAPVYKKLAEKLHINTETFSFRVFQMFRTFFALCISRIIVKAPNIAELFQMLKALFTSFEPDLLLGLDGRLFSYGVSQREMFIVFLALLVLLTVGILQERGIKLRETIAKQNLVFRWTLVLGLLAVILIFGVYGPDYDASSFIYGDF